VRRHLRRRGPQRASAAPPATALRPCRAARAVALARVTGRRLCPTPSRAGALRRRAVEERQRWRRPRHLVPWRRRPSPASPRAPAQHGSPSIAMRAAAKCLASMSTQLRPVDSTTYRDEERREAGNHRRSASATPGPAGHLRWRLRRRRDARQPWGRVITHILCQQRRTESRTWRHGVRHGERQEQGLGGAFPPPAGRVTETRGGTRGVQQDMKGVNRSLSPWRQNTPWAYP
jgi:hypothetical protein